MRLPGGIELRNPTTGEVSRALGIGLRARAARGGRSAGDRRRPGRAWARRCTARRRASTRSSSRAPALGGQAGTSRRIENYLGFPAGISGSELTSRAITQARKFNARTATPYRALSLEPGTGRHVVRLEERSRDRGARGPARHRRRSTGGCRSTDLEDYEGISVFYAAGPPEAQRVRRRRASAWSAAATRPAQAAVWLARGGALVTLLHRRARPARDDVRLSHPRARALRRRRARPQRGRRAPRQRRAARGRHASKTASGCRSPSCSCSSARARAPIGSTTSSRATRRASY